MSANIPYLVKPHFNKRKNMIKIPCDPMNVYMRSKIYDTFSNYQRCFNLFSWAPMNKKGDYILHSMHGAPLLFQTHKNCGWNPLGDVRMSSRTATPCNGKINAEFCDDELYDGCFDILLNWTGRGRLELDSTGRQIVNDMIATLGQNATYGALLTLIMGSYFDPNSPDVKFGDHATEEEIKAFKTTIGTCRGIFDLVRSLGANPKYQHLNRKGVLKCTDFLNNCYTKDVIKLFDDLKGEAPSDLSCLMDEGGIPNDAFGAGASPIMVVSKSIHKKIVRQYQEQCLNIYCTNPRLGFEEKSVTGATPMKVYTIDGIPVIPLKYGNYFDKFLTGDLHFAFLTVSGNMTLGGSFGGIPDVNRGDIGMVIQRETNVKDYGKTYIMSHALFYAGLADYDFFTGTQLWCVPSN